VLERRSIVGGAAVTEEFHPGFRNSSCSYTVSLLNPRVIADLRLAEHGLRIVERPFANFLPLPDGATLSASAANTLPAEVARFSRRDAERLPNGRRCWSASWTVLRALATETPPNVSDRFVLADWLASCRWRASSRGWTCAAGATCWNCSPERRRTARRLVRVRAAQGRARLGLDRRQLREPLCARLGLRAAAPCVRRGQRQAGAWGHAIGGMGAISDAIAEARARGVRSGPMRRSAGAGAGVGRSAWRSPTAARSARRVVAGEPEAAVHQAVRPGRPRSGAAGAVRTLPLRVRARSA
jgi:hypothetical protein